MRKNRTKSKTEIADNMGLIYDAVNNAKQVLPRSVTLESEDLVGVAAIALHNAQKSFDPEKGTCFSTYASHKVYRGLQEAIRKNNPLGRTIGDFQRDLEKAQELLIARLKRPPTRDELASVMGLEVARLEELMEQILYRNPISLESQATVQIRRKEAMDGEQDWVNIYDALAGKGPDITDEVDSGILSDFIESVINRLPHPGSWIIRLRYLEEMTLAEIQESTGLSRNKVREHHDKAFALLKQIVFDRVKRGKE